MKKWIVAAMILIPLGTALAISPRIIEQRQNWVLHRPPYTIPPQARALFENSVDLHADPLLWGRDLLDRSKRGEVDVPRLLEAGAALQVFGVVTQSPAGQNIRRNSGSSADRITQLALVSHWPLATLRSRLQRALYQAKRLRDMEQKSTGQLVPILTRADLGALLDRRKAGERTLGALLALEGSQALEGDLANVDVLWAAGFRMMSPAHFVDTEISGSAHGASQEGLTPLGKRWVRELESRRIIVDLAHASPRTIVDVLALANRPVVVSHTGVRATCDNQRNLSDDQLRALAKNGALVGIGYWDNAVCGTDAAAIARAMRHAADVMGVAHIALGSDFDGAVVTPFDATGVPLLASALHAERFTDADIAAIAGGNAIRFFLEQLPESR